MDGLLFLVHAPSPSIPLLNALTTADNDDAPSSLLDTIDADERASFPHSSVPAPTTATNAHTGSFGSSVTLGFGLSTLAKPNR